MREECLKVIVDKKQADWELKNGNDSREEDGSYALIDRVCKVEDCEFGCYLSYRVRENTITSIEREDVQGYCIKGN